MLMRYGQAALIAAMVTLMGNGVWAQDNCPQGGFSTGYAFPVCCKKAKCSAPKDCCESQDCCKDGKCCKEEDCCKAGKCCKSNKCDCATGGDCCCKKGECNCKKSSCCEGACCSPVAVGDKSTKATTIIVVMPSMSPLFPTPIDMGMMPHPMMPPMPGMMSPQVMPPQMVGLPMPPSPMCYGCPMPSPCIPPTPSFCVAPCKEPADPCSSLVSAACALCSALRPLSMPSLCATAMEMMSEHCPATYVQAPMPTSICPILKERVCPTCGVIQTGINFDLATPNGAACPLGSCTTITAAPQCEVVPCTPVCKPMTCAKSASACKVLLCAKSSDDRVVMCVGDDTSVCGKKLTVKIGDNSLALTCFDDRVRVRGEDLKATADYIRSERKDCLILEGDVVLHYKKDGHTVNVTGDCIELNLSSGAVTIKPAE